MSSNPIATFMQEVKDKMAEHAESAMLMPKHDLFELGQSAGKYQGMNEALLILDAILRDQLEKEQNS